MTVADQGLDLLHVSSDVYSNAVPGDGLVSVGAAAMCGVVALAALCAAPEDLRTPGFEHRAEGCGKLALAGDAALTGAALLTYGSSVSNAFVLASRPFTFVHGATDLAIGIREIRRGQAEHHRPRIVKGAFQTAMGAGVVVSSVAPAFGSLSLMLSCGVLVCLAGKEAAMHWDRARR